MRSIRELSDLTNVPVLVRAALNVPIADGTVANTFRLRSALPTIEYLRSRHARVILIGHLGEKGTETLAPVCAAMQQLVPRLSFCPVSSGPDARAAVRNMAAGDVLMLENLRRNKGEVTNDKKFAAALAELADIFVEDAFDVCHREHASVVSVPELLPSYAGLLVEEEVKHLSRALTPGTPSLAIIGGAKFSTKEPVLERLLEVYNRVFVGGALANDFMRASGKGVGKSLISADADDRAIRALLASPRIMLPLDEVVAPAGATHDLGRVVTPGAVPADQMVLDDGPKTVDALAKLAAGAKTILWNGPLGNYEHGFTDATEGLAKAIAQSGAYSILGGGDTVAAVEKLGLSDKFSFISTGGGAMLDFLATGTLPGLVALG
ncbi:MAG: Phosphoglycerate kinase [Parcubacteria group bacterium]|nr:Phosphoglycerate kinase [Parcubacteria group bacterium]